MKDVRRIVGRQERPLVSICTPVHNGERYLRESVDSSLAQTWDPVEVVVVDDCSTDSSGEILASYGERVRALRHARNSGYAASVNTALRAARGEYLAFCNADDLLEPELVERHLGTLLGDRSLSISYSGFYRVGPEGGVIERAECPGFPSHRALRSAIARSCFITLASAVVHRRVFERVGLMDPMNSHSADWEFWTRALLEFDARVIPEPLARYRVHPGQSSRQSDQMRRSRNLTRARVAKSYPLSVWAPAYFRHHLDEWIGAGWKARNAPSQTRLRAASEPLMDLAGFFKALCTTPAGWTAPALADGEHLSPSG